MLDHYLHTAHAAAALLNPHREPIASPPRRPGVDTGAPRRPSGRRWPGSTPSTPVLLAAVDQAAAAGLRHPRLAAGLGAGGLPRPAGPLARLGRHPARPRWPPRERLGDRAGQARAHRILGRACTRLGRFDDAHAHLRQALELYTRARRPRRRRPTPTSDLGSLLRAAGPPRRAALGHTRQALDLFTGRGRPGRAGPGAQRDRLATTPCSATTSRPSPTASRRSTCSQELGDRHGEAAHLGQPRLRPPPPRPPRRAVACYQQALACSGSSATATARPTRSTTSATPTTPPGTRRGPRRLAAGARHPRRPPPSRRRPDPRQARRPRRGPRHLTWALGAAGLAQVRRTPLPDPWASGAGGWPGPGPADPAA